MLKMFCCVVSPLHCLWAANSCSPGVALKASPFCYNLIPAAVLAREHSTFGTHVFQLSMSWQKPSTNSTPSIR